jgi:hypothetical protein
MKRFAGAIFFLAICFTLRAQTPLPSTAAFDIGFSPGGSALVVVQKAIINVSL